MHDTNLGNILYFMATNELDLTHRSQSTTEYSTNISNLRWTVAEEASQMEHIFDNLSTVYFTYSEQGIIRRRTNAITMCSFQNAISFYCKYHQLNKWDDNVYDTFIQLLYLRAVKLAEIATGIRMDYNWLETTLRDYGESSNAFHINMEPEELKNRIRNGEFEPTEEEKALMSTIFSDLEKELDNTLTNLYGFVYSCFHNLWYNF